MHIRTFIYTENGGTQETSHSNYSPYLIKDAMDVLLNKEIDFFEIVEDASFIEITLNDRDEPVINGFELTN